MKKIKFGYYSWTDPRMRNPRNYSIPQEKYRGAHVQKLSPWATDKGEPGKVLTRAPCAKIYCLGPSKNGVWHSSVISISGNREANFCLFPCNRNRGLFATCHCCPGEWACTLLVSSLAFHSPPGTWIIFVFSHFSHHIQYCIVLNYT